MPKDRKKLTYAVFLVFIAIFVFVTLKGLTTPQPGDENVYYYMGRLVSEGKLPYKDFFYAHPPLHIYLIAAAHKIFGFNVMALKLIPLLSTLALALFIFKIAKEKFGDASALISSALFLFSYIIMFNSVFSFLEKIGFTGFERKNDLIEFIKLNSDNGTLLFGDDSVVPLLSLLTNNKIALDFVDTNNQVFISGARNLSSVLSDLKGKDILFIIRSKQGISYFKEVRNFLRRNCQFLSSFHDKIEGDYLVYRCG